MIAQRSSTGRDSSNLPTRPRLRWALSGAILLAALLAGRTLLVTKASPASQVQATLDYSTLRVHGYPALGHPDDPPYANRPAGPGSNSQNDPLTGLVPEEAPYTVGDGPFDPLSGEAPEMDMVTWNPAWISERLGDAALRANWPALRGIDEVSAGSNIRAGGVNASEKVWLRHWYEPMHLDLDLNADGRLTSDNSDLDYGAPLAPVNPTPSAIDEWYPAIMTEYTYMLMENDPLPVAHPLPAELGRSAPRATCGRVGATRIVFPVGIEQAAADPAGPAVGQGLTSLDADFDGRLDMINVTDEAGLPSQLGGMRLDFDGDGVLDTLNPDGQPLTCDELAVLHTDAMRLHPGGRIQFLDHYVQVQSVTGNTALLEVYYTGDLVPRLIQRRSVAIGAAALAGDTGPLLVLGAGSTNLGTLPPGAWFVYVQDVDSDDDTAIVTVGRALGAPCASMQQAPQQFNLRPGGPYFLKRFYVDGHEYNVSAIYACDSRSFQYLSLRAPLPKVPVTLETHSVRLQEHSLRRSLTLLPPFNHEHTILDDIDEAPDFSNLQNPTVTGPRPEVLYMGSPVGPVPPVLGEGEALPYRGRISAAPVGPYSDIRATRWFYNEETTDPAFIGQLREKVGALAPQSAPGAPDRFFYNEQIFTLPWHYTEFVLPDLDEGVGPGAVNADDYLVTTAFTNPTARWRRWRMPAGAVPATVPPVPPDLVSDFTPDNGFSLGAPRRAAFWFDPDDSTKLFYDPSGVRLYGGQPRPTDVACDPRRPSLSAGAGDLGARDPISATLPVEVPPYTDPFAPFNPQHPHAPRGDSLTFNPAYMDEFRNFGEPLRTLYSQISAAGQNAREKVYHRSWYEPEYITKIRQANACDRDLSFPAVMQEFTYTYVDMTDRPTAAAVGSSRFAFPIGSLATELPAPLPGGSLPAGGDFGYGLTTFDANFDALGDAVTVHSERTLAAYLDAQWQASRPIPPGPPPPVVPGPRLDFDGDGVLDGLNADGVRLNGDEMVVFAVESVALDLDPNTPQAASAMVLDHLVTLDNVSRGSRAQLRFWFTGGGAAASRPEPVGGPQSLNVGDAAIVDRFQDSVTLVGPAGINSGPRGAWFVFLESADANADGDQVTLTVGRALGASHSAIDDGNGMHDLLPGDPWYLKRFYVDGHEYNVVALDTETAAGGQTDRFAFITIRTPTPKGNYFNPQDTLLLQGYFLNGLPPGMPVMPPFNTAHTVVQDVERQPRTAFADPSGLTSCVGDLAAAPARELIITAEEPEPRLATQLREIWDRGEAGFRWETDQLRVTPGSFTELRLPRGQQALLTLNWTSAVSRLGFYGCSPIRPGPFPDGAVGVDHDAITAAANGWAPPAGIIPARNRDRTVDVAGDDVTLPYYDARIGAQPVRVKFFYDPANAQDPYINPRPIPIPQPRDPRLVVRKVLTSPNPTVRGALARFTITVFNTGNLSLTDVDLRDVFDTVHLDFVSASRAPTSVNEAGGILVWDNIEGAAPGGTFDPGEQIVITVDYTATVETPNGSPATNTVRATALGGAVIADPAADDVEIDTPRLELEKRLITSDPTSLGSTVTYQLLLLNSGTAVLTDVDVSDNFDTVYLDFLNASIAPATVNEAGGALTWNNVETAAPGGTFDPGEQIIITVNFRAAALTPDPVKARNTASASALGGTVLTGRVTREVEVNPAPAPSLQLVKQLRGQSPFLVGDTVAFNIAVVNNGNTTLTNVDLTDSFDTTYLDYITASFTPVSINEAGGQVSWDNIEVLAPGGTFDPGEQVLIIVTFRATAVTPDPQRAVNRALVTTPGLTVPPAQADVEINAAAVPGISIIKRLTSPDPTTVGATVTFELVVSNTGNTVLTDVDVADSYSTIPLDFLSASLAPTANNDGAGTISWNNLEGAAPGGTFDPGESILIIVRFRAMASTVDPVKAQNQASVAAVGGTVLAGPAQASVEINRPAVSITKRLTSVNPASVGGDVGFQIVIRNDGDIPLIDVNVDDLFEATYLAPQGAVPPAAQVNAVAGTMRWLDIESAAPGGTFDPGDQIVIDLVFRARVATPAGDPASNQVSVATNGANVIAGPASASVTINSTMQVTALACNAVGERSIEVSWTDASIQETGFELQAAVGDSGFIPIGSPTSSTGPQLGDEQRLLLNGLLPGQTHHFRVRADDARTGMHSSWLEAESSCATTAVAPQTVGCVSGRVVAEGRVSNADLAIMVDGAPAGTTAVDGSFRVCQVPAGERLIAAQGACFLHLEAAGTRVTGGATTALDEAALTGGDVNNSQGVDLFDLVRVGADFRASPPNDEAADCTGDGAVNIFDLVMVGANYDLDGPLAWSAQKVAGRRPLQLTRALALAQDEGPLALRQRQQEDGTITVDIVLRSDLPMYGADLELAYDGSQVAVVDALPDWPETQILPGPAWGEGAYLARNRVDAQAQRIRLAASLKAPSEPLTGEQVLATVQLRPLVDRPDAGALKLLGVSLSDIRGREIPLSFTGREIQTRPDRGRLDHWLSLPWLGSEGLIP